MFFGAVHPLAKMCHCVRRSEGFTGDIPSALPQLLRVVWRLVARPYRFQFSVCSFKRARFGCNGFICLDFTV